MIKWIEAARDFQDKNIIDLSQISKLEKYKLSIKSFQDELENAIYELIGFHGTNLSNQSGNGLVQNAREMVNAQMYQKPMVNQPQVNAHSQDQMPTSSGISNPLILPYPGKNTANRPSNRPVVSNEYAESNNRMSCNNYIGVSPTSKTYITPAGHYGYPHDRNPLQDNDPRQMAKPMFDALTGNSLSRSQSYIPSNPQKYVSPHIPGLQDRNYLPDFEEDISLTEGYGDQSFVFAGRSKNNPLPSHFQKTNFNHGQNYQNRGQLLGNEQLSNGRMGNLNRTGNSLNSEHGIRFEITRLQQEEFALSQTIKALEERYDAGYITSAEFMKSYREMQKEIYNTQSQIAQFQKYLDETYGLMNN